MQLAGHSQMSTTQRYIDTRPDILRNAGGAHLAYFDLVGLPALSCGYLACSRIKNSIQIKYGQYQFG